jgi:hypothetical protein
MNSTRFDPHMYAAQVQVAVARAWRTPWPYIVAFGWVLLPFVMATCLHSSDMIRLQAKLQGLPKPHLFTSQQLASGEVQTLFVLGVLVLMQIVATTLFYRQVKMSHVGPVAVPTLWVLAALIGIIGDAAWVAAGQHDLPGMLIGLSSVPLTVLSEWVVNGLGRDFVFGTATGAHPPISQPW